MAFSVPTREQIASLFTSDYAGAQPEKNVARGSDPYRLARVVSGAIWNLLAKLLYFDKQRLPDTAQAENLERWGNIYALERKAAQSSEQLAALRVSGVVGAAVPEFSELSHADGTLYQTTSIGAVIGADGTVDVNVEAISTGLATNKGVGEVLTFTTPPTDVEADAEVVIALTDGLDIEDYEVYRPRLLAHIGDPPEGGAIHDYEAWAKRNPGVTTAYVWAHRRGTGTIDVAVLGSGTGANRIPSDAQLGVVDDYIEAARPGNARDWLLLETTTQAQDVVVEPEDDDNGSSWDWDDEHTGYAISNPDEDASTIEVLTAPASVIAGVRITVLGEEAYVTNRTGDVLTLRFDNDYDGNEVTWFTFDPTGEDIRASGDLVKPIRHAVIALFNTLGPARSRWSRTPWISELKRSKLFGAITDVPHCDDANLITPASNVVPADLYDDTVPFLVPGNICVWKPA